MDLSAEDLIGGLADLRQDGILCDITLQTDDKDIVAHRALLAAASLYFRAMFGGNFKEAKEDVINLDALGVSSVGLSAIVDCLYSLKLNITKNNFIPVTEAANLLQFVSIIPLCEKFLQSNLDIQNCIQILQMCETYNMKSAKRAVDRFFLENLIAVSEQNPDFVEMSKDCLVRYIADTKLATDDEIEVYRAVMKWIKYAPSRSEYTTEIMQHIRMCHIPVKLIARELAQESLLIYNEQCGKQVLDAFDYHRSPYKQPLIKTLPPRGELAVMMYDMYPDISETEWYLKSFPSYDKSFETVGPDPLPVECGVSLGGFAFFVCKDESEPVHSHIRYDPISDQWLSLEPAPFPSNEVPQDFLYQSLEDKLILGGGEVFKGQEPGRSVSACYIYSVEYNTWRQTKDLPEAMHSPVSCVHNNLLYIASYYNEDYDQEEGVKKLWMFDSGNEVWSEKAVPLSKHLNGIFAALGDKLLLAGGLNGAYFDPWGMYQQTAEVYDIETNQWSSIESVYPYVAIWAVSNLEAHCTTDQSGDICCYGITHAPDSNGQLPGARRVIIEFNPDSGYLLNNRIPEQRYNVVGKVFVIVPKGRFKH